MHNVVQLFWQSYIRETAMFACDDQHNNGEQRQRIAKDRTLLGINKSRENACSMRYIHGQHDNSPLCPLDPTIRLSWTTGYWQLYRNSIVLHIALLLLELHAGKYQGPFVTTDHYLRELYTCIYIYMFRFVYPRLQMRISFRMLV